MKKLAPSCSNECKCSIFTLHLEAQTTHTYWWKHSFLLIYYMLVFCLYVDAYFYIEYECVRLQSLAWHRSTDALCLPMLMVYICVNQHVHVFRPHPRISCPSSQLVHPVSTFYTCVPPPPPPPPRPRGPAQCWRRRCPGVSRPRWGWAPPGHDTTPTHTSSSWPSPVEEGGEEQRVSHRGTVWRGWMVFPRLKFNFQSYSIFLIWLVMRSAWCNLLDRLNATC